MLFPFLPEVIENHIIEYASNHRDKFTQVLRDLLMATHCHGCGDKCQVSLIGYSNRFCEKRCWYRWEATRYIQNVIEDPDMDEFPPIDKEKTLCHFGSYDCECNVTLANTNYFNRIWANSRSPTNICWPMGDYMRHCYNECIKNRNCIDVGR